LISMSARQHAALQAACQHAPPFGLRSSALQHGGSVVGWPGLAHAKAEMLKC
jgi:hypothetical protein